MSDIEPLVAEIRRVMATHIPDFEQKFSVDFTETAINEVRTAKSFAIQTARALIFGETGVGKTTTINYVLNSPIFPTSGELSCTQSLACGEHEGGLIFYDSPGLGDEAGLENVTRTALGIPLLEDEPLDGVTLLDLTADHAEGPSEYTLLPYEAFAAEIAADFYTRQQANIVGKRFAAPDFATWAASHFDFFVFVTSSNRGLPAPIAKTLQAFEQAQPQATLFKVFNVFGGTYQGDVDSLAPPVLKKYQQAQERSRKVGLTTPDEWHLIDSQTGQGVAALIEAFAQRLPMDLLRGLRQVVQQRYAHLIEARIASYYFDYVAHVATLLALFPVDYATQGQSFLRFAMQSLVTMAEFMFVGQRPIPPTVVDSLIGELAFSKRRLTYTDTVVKRKRENPLLEWVDKVGKQVNPEFDAYDQLNAYELQPQRVPQTEYFTLGGIDALQLTLGFGLALQTLASAADLPDNPTPSEIETVLENSRRTVEYHTSARLRGQLVQAIRLAREQDDQANRLDLATTLYPQVRPLLGVAEAG